MTNAELGMWLFLAAEVMLFGALISAYVLLRVNTDAWQTGGPPLELRWGGLATALQVLSGFAMVQAVAVAKAGRFTGALRRLRAAGLLGLCFLGVQGLQYAQQFQEHLYPVVSTYYSIYYALTGVYALHVAAGLVAILVLAVPGEPGAWARRTALTGMYWNFLNVVWIVLFVLLYMG